MAEFTFDDSAFDEITNELNNFIDKVHELDGSTIRYQDLFNSDFMSLHANSLTIDDFLAACNIVIDDQDDFDSLFDNDVFNLYVSKNTDFTSWEEMYEEATTCYLDGRLDL